MQRCTRPLGAENPFSVCSGGEEHVERSKHFGGPKFFPKIPKFLCLKGRNHQNYGKREAWKRRPVCFLLPGQHLSVIVESLDIFGSFMTDITEQKSSKRNLKST